MHFVKRVTVAVFALALLFMTLPFAANAEAIETNRTVRLDINYEYGGTPIPNALIYLYRVGNISPGGFVSLNSTFGAYPIDSSLLYSSEIQQAANLLYHYILLDQLSPDIVVATSSDGTISKEMQTGLYLIVPQRINASEGIFRSEPALISLPFRASSEDSWSYHATYQPKCSFTPQGRVGKMNLYVTKKWENVASEDHPDKVTVYLLKDQTVFDRAELNDSNRWIKRWYDLPEDFDWRVVEEPVPGYTVMMSGNLGSVLLTNTAEDVPDLPVTPDETKEPEETTIPEETGEPDETTDETTGNTQDTTSTETNTHSQKPSGSGGSHRPKLPQTGLLWWPVPVLLFMGLALIFLGVNIRRGAKYEE